MLGPYSCKFVLYGICPLSVVGLLYSRCRRLVSFKLSTTACEARPLRYHRFFAKQPPFSDTSAWKGTKMPCTWKKSLSIQITSFTSFTSSFQALRFLISTDGCVGLTMQLTCRRSWSCKQSSHRPSSLQRRTDAFQSIALGAWNKLIFNFKEMEWNGLH